MSELRAQIEHKLLEKYNDTGMVCFGKKVFETHGSYFCVASLVKKEASFLRARYKGKLTNSFSFITIFVWLLSEYRIRTLFHKA